MKSQYKKIGLMGCLVVSGFCVERGFATDHAAARVPAAHVDSIQKRNTMNNIKDRYVILENKLDQLETHIDKTSGRQKRNLQADWNKFDKERVSINEQIESLANVQNDKWESAVSKVDKDLVSLNKKLDKAIR